MLKNGNREFYHSDTLTRNLTSNFFFLPATFAEAVERFNSNIPYNGLLHAVTQDVS